LLVGCGVKKLALGIITRNISETAEDRAKLHVNSLYKVICGLSIASEIYDFE